jgi:hypothetical protein
MVEQGALEALSICKRFGDRNALTRAVEGRRHPLFLLLA